MVDADLLISSTWAQGPEENNKAYYIRTASQNNAFRQLQRTHGKCYMIKYDDGDTRPMWEDQINITKLKKEIKDPLGNEYDCPLCQPYDMWDSLFSKHLPRLYLTKIIIPRYSDGFIDVGGTWQKCHCLAKGEERRRLKFIIGEIK